MSISTVIGLAGKRLVIQPSKTNPKFATFSILGANREVLASVAMPADHCDMVREAAGRLALELEALPEMLDLPVLDLAQIEGR